MKCIWDKNGIRGMRIINSSRERLCGGIGRSLKTTGLVEETGFYPEGNGEPWKDFE